MTPARERLVHDLASQAGLVLRNVRLIAELRESRRRIVTAQDARAKALERNIHDGAQQQLVALSVKLRLAEQGAERDPASTKQLLAQLQGDATDALENLRDLARGIYPPLLADKGLPSALEAQARKSLVPTTVETDGVGRHAADVESAIYFSCLEALQNVAKYAGASNVKVALAQVDGELSFAVTDDGQGFDPDPRGYGTGLQGIADRLEVIGGRLEVLSSRGAGTTIKGSVPVSVHNGG
jgi:signal transduction histidine kinase